MPESLGEGNGIPGSGPRVGTSMGEGAAGPELTDCEKWGESSKMRC